MQLPDLAGFTAWISTIGIALIEMIGALIIVGYVVRALITVIRTRDIRRARLQVAEGVIMGLSLKVAASLLKTLVLLSWDQILLFAVILAIRTILRMLFTWEQQHIAPRLPGEIR